MKDRKSGYQSFKEFFERIGLGDERDLFLENLSSLLASGIPIIDAISSVNEEVQSKRLRNIIHRLSEDIESGRSLSTSLERTGLFSPHVASLIRIGERSGRLIENIKVIAAEQKKERSLTSKLRAAAMYPVFVLGLTVVIGTGIAWFILPNLATVFSSLRIELPIVTRVLIGIGVFLGKYGNIVVPSLIVGGIFLFYVIFTYQKTKILGEYLLFKLPGVKQLMREAEVARFGYLLGTLISAGLSPTDALSSLAKASAFRRYRKFYEYLSDSVTSGNSFKRSFENYPGIRALLPVTVQQLVVAGEQSGTLPDSLVKIGADFENKTDSSAKNLTVILEPVLLVIVWLGVVGVAIAVILPIYSLIGGFKVSP
ncbi:type II secretion system F family protein [Patescibacteria group bacterium]|nr:type II secretion system F family protein [Patescibacteria group bacterium]